MAKTLRSTILCVAVSFLGSSISLAQSVSWPFPSLQKPTCETMPSAPPVHIPANNTATKWPVVNNGAWNNPSTWNGGTVPTNMDIVCIPANVTVRVTNPTYEATNVCPVPASQTNNSPRLFIFVCGTINFSSGGKLHLGCMSALQIFTGGLVVSAQGNSDLIRIGTKEVWRENNSSINGPFFINDGCGTSPLGCQGAGVLPVEFGSFYVNQRTPCQVELNWTTLTELNVAYFVTERSQDGTNWHALGKIAANGQSNTTTPYRFNDMQAPAGAVFYRLRQVDTDGRFYFSDVVRISIAQTKGMQLFPNPVGATATLFSPGGFSSTQSIQIFGANGNLVQTIPGRPGNSISWSTEKLNTGIYTIRVIENGQLQSQTRMLKQ